MFFTAGCLVVVAIAALWVFRCWRRPAYTASILDTEGRLLPRSVATLEQLWIGGVKQGVLVRGQNVSNPVLLYLHGGPGTSELGMLRQHNMPTLEKHFTVAVWDQRGAGISFAAGKPESGMTVEQFIADTHEVTLVLCERFQQPKIYLVGHSWGSMLGMVTVQRHPERYHAYIGVGQVVDMREGERISFDWTLAQARKAGNGRAMARLQAMGPPPYLGQFRRKLMLQRRLLGKFGGEVHGNPRGGMPTMLRGVWAASEYSWQDRINVFRGVFANMRSMWPQIIDIDLRELAPEIHVPVVFLEGRFDFEALSMLAEAYFQQLRAPNKTWIWFEKSAHFPNTEEAEKFNRFFIERLVQETTVRSSPQRSAETSQASASAHAAA